MRHTLLQSFQFAGRGLHHAFWSQRTMRVHTLLACGVVAATVWLRLSPAEMALVVLAMFGVLAAELMNTAIETIVDLQVGDDHHFLAGQAKDLSAAAVLVAAGGAAIVGLIVLLPPISGLMSLPLDGLAVGRGATLIAMLVLVYLALRPRGERGPSRASPSRGPR